MRGKIRTRSDVTPDLLRELLRYEPDTGHLYWKPRSPEKFLTPKLSKNWNERWAGKLAMRSFVGGHLNGNIFGFMFGSHRVAWAIHYGQWPEQFIDHINGDPQDNRIVNLRDVSAGDNQRNRARSKYNKTGHPGIVLRPSSRWRAKITYQGKFISLGTYGTFAEAKDARMRAERELGFHPNHGRPLN